MAHSPEESTCSAGVAAGPAQGRRQDTAAKQTHAHFPRAVSAGSWEARDRQIYMVFKLQRETKREMPISSKSLGASGIVLVTLKLKQELDARYIMLLNTNKH